LKCENEEAKYDWIILPEVNKPLSEIVIKAKVPVNVIDDTCQVFFEVTDNDSQKELTIS
jgi:hypothetical protein